jgi:hypothetical protein
VTSPCIQTAAAEALVAPNRIDLANPDHIEFRDFAWRLLAGYGDDDPTEY